MPDLPDDIPTKGPGQEPETPPLPNEPGPDMPVEAPPVMPPDNPGMPPLTT
jgi:hypothetical protein